MNSLILIFAYKGEALNQFFLVKYVCFTLWFDLTQKQMQSPDFCRGKPKILDLS